MKSFVASLLLAASLFGPQASAGEFTPESYRAVFQGDSQFRQKQAIEALAMAGLSDPAIFDALEARLIASLPEATDKTAVDYSAWLVKGLAYSGNDKYLGTIDSLIHGSYPKKLRKYAKQARANLSQYKVWNAILTDKSHYDIGQSQSNNLYANALHSNELELMRMAAKRLMEESKYDDFMLSQLSSELQAQRLLSNDKLAIDTYAHMAKALASSGNVKYRPVIADIAANAPQKKLRNYAAKYMKSYY
ncbi:hypothetical protein [Shewanella salipaludis]|uniref:Uncharacterized protein n=1 Tax=Shewanella salipaludis TaxID=2723052 RepID=A0A972FVD1_9GAMM|nr:hypothetical protein [Shewanella salipaludis]NMH66297.1 hypothetical protein [Shewanella salipaludis]